jgi:hypothetical protein
MLNLIKEYNLDNYIVELYQEQNSPQIPSETLDSITTTLNDQLYPNNIVERLDSIKNIKQIIIYSKSREVILVSDNE